jgi:hypothetical protein
MNAARNALIAFLAEQIIEDCAATHEKPPAVDAGDIADCQSQAQNAAHARADLLPVLHR